MNRLALVFVIVFGLLAPAAQAQGQGDVTAFRQAVDLIEAQDWAGAEAAVAGQGTVVRDLVRWMRLRAGAEGGAVFAAYENFLAARPHWPGLDRLRARGEETMPEGLPPQQVLDWFQGVKPQTGQGAVRLAQALDHLGRTPEADAVLAEAWVTLGLTDAGHAAMLAAFGDRLLPHHWPRTEAMLWRWRTSDASRMLPLLSPDYRQLAEARIAMIRGDGDRLQRAAAVPASLRNDAGLAYDRFNRLADRGDYSDAVTILLERTGSAAGLGDPFRWASWRATLARWAMREGRPQDAYRMATSHHLTEGDLYADLEWVAGYVALTYLEDPAAARTHFERLEAAVRGPISLSRAAYWLGRAQEAAGDPAAPTSYARAAVHQTAFYGLLAAERLGLPLEPTLVRPAATPDWRQSGMLAQDLTAAMLVLLAADQRTEAVLFATKQAQLLDVGGIGQLGQMLLDMNETFFALTVAKEALRRDILVPAIYHPLHPMAQLDLSVDPALALAIARQESEFNAEAGSPVGALGLMQLMPATAEEVAGELGLGYTRARLTSDWGYNATLGSRYLANLEAMFGQTPVMVAAGYNAGPSRPRTWNSQRGDPRKGEIDVIDWIEHIPFSETRNYVMRVTEGLAIYRARLSGQGGVVRFTDLLVGAPPLVRPVARPVRGVAPAAFVPSTVVEGVTVAVNSQLPVPAAVDPDAGVATAPGLASGSVSPLAPVRALRPVLRPQGQTGG